MTRNQLLPGFVKSLDATPMFTVDGDGNVTPGWNQTVAPDDGSILIQADPVSSSVYAGYVCAWRGGACCCSKLIANLGGEPHMKVSGGLYWISASVTENVDYTIYTTTSETGSGPTHLATTGGLHIGYRAYRARERHEAKENKEPQELKNAPHSEDQVESAPPPKVELRIDPSLPEEAQTIIANEFRRIFS